MADNDSRAGVNSNSDSCISNKRQAIVNVCHNCHKREQYLF